MSKLKMTQSQSRFSDSLGALFLSDQDYTLKQREKLMLFLKSSTDVGVIRNGGRNGAKYAPQSFLSVFKRFNQNQFTEEFSFLEKEVACEKKEWANFSEAQAHEAQTIAKALHLHLRPWICHLGGGHDHIYPLLVALAQQASQIIVINIDAHADTRTDPEAHSGTPFRQFAQETSKAFELFQLGLHPYANSRSTLSALPQGPMSILWREELKDLRQVSSFFKKIKEKIHQHTRVVFSVDADALDGQEVPGVSAVNAQGLRIEELKFLWQEYCQLPLPHAPIMGIYELNPVYDNLAALSMRKLASVLYEALK